MTQTGKKKNCLILGLILFTITLYAKTGNEIIATAETYRYHPWKCNTWNARPENIDNNRYANNYNYPFWPENQPYQEFGSTELKISTGQYTGVVYGWGLGDTIGNYNSKLTNRNPEFLVGNYTDQINIQMYAGVDCSGFLARSIGFPVLKVNPSHPTLGNYYILHPTTEDFIEEIFTDEIEWGEIKKGDILIRRYYEEDTNGDGKISSNERHYGHIGIAMGKPNGTTQKNCQLKIINFQLKRNK